MAYSVDFEARIITVPRADLIFLSLNRYKLDLDEFRRKCRALESDPLEGLSYPPIIEYYPAVDTGDVILGRVVLIINGYQLELEDTVERYSALFDGANTNLHNNSLITNGIPTPNNSAGLQDLSTLLASAYSNRVVVNTTKGQAGQASPIGTLKTPSNNIPDAVGIADFQGIRELYIADSLALGVGDIVSGLQIVGASPARIFLTINPEADVSRAEFEYLLISGTLDGQAIIKECLINGLDYVTGFIQRSGLLASPIILGANSQATLIDCFSNVAGIETPTLDMGGSGQSLAIRGYSGGIRITNRTGIDNCSIDMNSGHVIIDASCTGSPITIRGSYKLTVETGATQPDTAGRTAMVSTTASKQDVIVASQL